jgi:hypothetical protein
VVIVLLPERVPLALVIPMMGVFAAGAGAVPGWLMLEHTQKAQARQALGPLVAELRGRVRNEAHDILEALKTDPRSMWDCKMQDKIGRIIAELDRGAICCSWPDLWIEQISLGDYKNFQELLQKVAPLMRAASMGLVRLSPYDADGRLFGDAMERVCEVFNLKLIS